MDQTQRWLEFDGSPEPGDLPSRVVDGRQRHMRRVDPTTAHARGTDPVTSHEAAAGVTPTLTARQEAVLAVFRVHYRLTDVELLERYARDRFAAPLPPQGPSGLRTRRHELVVLGKLVADGTEYIGCRRHTVWRLAP